MATATRDPHDAAIAELRAKRRARLRALAWRSTFATIGLVLLAAIALYWLLTTIRGRDVLLAQIAARLPVGSTLTWGAAEGPASGPMTLRDVRFVYRGCPDKDGEPVKYPGCAKPRIVEFFAKTLVLDPALRPLLGRRLRLDALDVTDATLDLGESDEPFELPRWPESLPQIAPPLSLQADAIRIDGLKITQARAPVIDIRSLRGGLDAATGMLHLERIAIDSDRGRFALDGDYVPREDYRMDLTATAVLPAPAGRTSPRLGFVARGNLARLDVAAAGRVPAPVRATLTLRGEDAPRWHARAHSEALDLALLTGSGEPSTPVDLDFTADGNGGDATLQGTLRRGDLAVRVLPSRVALDDQVLTVAPLALELLGGTATLRGRADFRDRANARFDGSLVADQLRWGDNDATSPTIVGDGDFDLRGTLDAWTVAGKATLLRDWQRAVVELDGTGDADKLVLKTLRATMPTGRLDGRGAVAWGPAFGWSLDARLAGFDPGYFLPEWTGAVDGKLVSTGTTRGDGGLDASVDATQLGGRLRNRALSGRGRVLVRLPAPGATRTDYEGDVALALGASRIDAKGTVAGTLAVDARLSPLQLNDLLPDGKGTLRGTLKLGGARDAPNVDVDLAGSGLDYAGYRAASATVKGRLPWKPGRADGSLAIDARGLDAGVAFDTLRVDARGAVEALRVDAQARGEIGALDLRGTAGKRGANWQGTLDAMQLAPAKGPAWRLQSPARYAQVASPRGSARWTLSPSCFASGGGGSLCASANWPQRLDITGTGLPLTLATPYLPEREDGRPWLLRGELALDAQVRPAGNSWRGTARVRSASGGLRLSERARRDVVAYDALVLDATFDPRRIDATLGATLNQDGRVDARVATGWDAYAPLSGEIAIDTDELTWMELFSPDIVEPTGKLEGRIALGGTRAQPAIGGQAHLSGFGADVPALAIALQNGDVRMTAQPDGSARIAGSVGTGDGVLQLDGTLGWQGDDTPLLLNLRGDNVLVSDTRDLRAVVSPDVQVRYAAGQPIAVTGRVGVPSAKLDLERLDEGVSVSEDVVVLDPVDPQRTRASPLELDLTLALGDDVQLHGFGLDGTLGGSLRVRSRQGREMTGTGTLEVDGRYAAYGQKLQITRGRLVWSNTPIADPVLDIRAERVVGDVTAGIDVDGRASNPQARVWSDRTTDESEALAYLALGRPLSSASGDEGRQLDAASAALSAGGSLLASQLGTKIGLDDAGVMQSRALGGSVFGVGKYLSPKLYVGYGVSLLGTGQVLTLKYLLRKGFDIEIESSSIENRGSINWRKEK